MIGIDEVGRGCWAGPLLIVAAKQVKELPSGLKDSKKLSKIRREKFREQIKQSCDIGEGWVTASEIDQCGLTEAMKMGVKRALEDINARPDELIIMDGNINYCGDEFTEVICEPKADDAYPIVSAASIYAKVERDKYMSCLGGDYSKYEFEKHVGYGTKLHSDLLLLHGVCDIHRLSFAPVARIATMWQ